MPDNPTDLFALAVVSLWVGAAPFRAGAETPEHGSEESEEVERPEESPRADDGQTTLQSGESAESEESDGERTVRTTARAPIPKFAAPRSTNVVDERQMERKQAQSITDALDEEPGNFVQSTNRGAGSVFLRGLVGPANLIYFDGVRFNQSTFRTGPNQYLNTVDPWALRRIEVVRGPGSVLYGSGAMGGVIQLFPRELPDDGPELRGRAFSESADLSTGGALDMGTEVRDVSLGAGGSFRQHGALRIGQGGNDDLVAPGEQGGRVPGSSFDESYFRSGVGAQLSDRSRLRLNYFLGAIEDATRVDRLGSGQVRTYDNRDDLLYATYEYDGVELVDELTWNLSYHRTEERVDRYTCETEPSRAEPEVQVATDLRDCAALERNVLRRHRVNEDTVQTVGTSAAASNQFLDRRLRVSAGLDIYGDTVESSRRDARAPDFAFTERDRGNFSSGSTYARTGVYTRGAYRLVRSGEHDLYLNAGTRVERFAASAPDVHEEIGDVSYQFTGLVGSAGVQYLYGTNFHSYLSWNQGFRAPNLQESTVLGNTGNFFEVPNDALGPERNDTFELGTKLDLPRLGRLTASAYVSLIDDKITREPADWNGETEIQGAPVRRRVNADTAYYTGADLSAETADVFGVSAFGFVSVIDGAVESDEPDASFEPGPLHDALGAADHYSNPRRLPPTQYQVGLEYAPSSVWYVRAFVLGAGAQTKLGPGDVDDLRICEVEPGVLASDAGRECSGTDAWATLNLRGGYAPWEFTRFDLSIENLTDRRYKYHGSGPPGPGIDATLMMTAETP